MLRPGPLEIGLVLVIILIVFGVGKLPQVGEAFGKGIRAFKRGTSGEGEGDKDKEKETKAEKKTKKKTKKRVAKKVTEAKVEDKVEAKTEAKA